RKRHQITWHHRAGLVLLPEGQTTEKADRIGGECKSPWSSSCSNPAPCLIRVDPGRGAMHYAEPPDQDTDPIRSQPNSAAARKHPPRNETPQPHQRRDDQPLQLWQSERGALQRGLLSGAQISALVHLLIHSNSPLFQLSVLKNHSFLIRPEELEIARNIENYFRLEIIWKRNRRMSQRVLE